MWPLLVGMAIFALFFWLCLGFRYGERIGYALAFVLWKIAGTEAKYEAL